MRHDRAADLTMEAIEAGYDAELVRYCPGIDGWGVRLAVGLARSVGEYLRYLRQLEHPNDDFTRLLERI